MRSETETQLPPVRSPAARADWGARLAGSLCVVFALIGLLPLALGLVVRSARAREWAAERTEELLRTFKVAAAYDVGVTLWPATVYLNNLRVESNDGKGAALTATHVSVRPRFFALLSGKLAIAEVEIESPVIRLAMHGKELVNLDVSLPKGKGGPFHAPFDVLSVEGARIDLDDDGLHVNGREIDLDVTVDDDLQAGSSFEIGLRAGETTFQNQRAFGPDHQPLDTIAFDDDDMCSIDARVRVDPDGLLVRRLEALGAIDLDVLPGTRPGCSLPPTDARKVELSLSHARVQFPAKGDPPAFSGFVHVRAPIGAAQRLAHLPETEGWVGVSADVQFGKGMVLPDAKGHVEVHDIRVAQFRFAKEILADIAITDRVIKSSETIVKIADGTATLRDIEVRPLEAGVPLKARLDVAGADFTTLMSNLGVSNRAHVAWDIRELHAPVVTGTLVPLHVDGDFTGSTGNFAVYDRPARDPARERIIGVRDAQLKARFAVRPKELEFQNIHVQTPKSELSGGFVGIGYHGSIRVDAPHNKIDLDDITPLAAIPIAGQAEVDLHVIGELGDPRLSADASFERFVFGDMPFGNVTQAHVDLRGKVVDIRDLKATRNKSTYEMPSFQMDALIASSGLGVRDFLGIFRMDDDPRFAGLDGTLLANADMHLALGGPEDSCGGGFVVVNAKTRAKKLDLFGEVFDDGEADLSYRWQDRLAGIAGADIEVHGITLHKVRGQGPAAIVGSILGSGAIHRGGVLSGQAVLDAIPLSRLNLLGKYASSTEGAASGVVTMKGTLDSWSAGGTIDVTPLRLRGATLGASHLTVEMSQVASSGPRSRGTTRCGAPIPAPFDREAYARDTSSQGEIAVDGDFFGGEVALRHVTVSRQKDAQVAGDVAFTRLDVAAVDRVFEHDTSRESPIGGELSGRLHIQHLDTGDLEHAHVTFTTGPTFFTRSGQKLALLTTDATIAVTDDALTIPNIVVALESSGGIGGSATASGTVTHLFHDPELALSAELAPVDLAVLPAVIPKVERSTGTLTGSLSIKGKASAPEINGALRVKGGDVSVRGLPAAVTDIDIDILADSTEIRIAKGEAKFAGGKVRTRGNIPITKDGFGVAKLEILANDIHIAPADGIATTFNTDLVLTDDLHASGVDALPHLTGDVIVTAFDYTRTANLELSALGGKSKKASVATYDPSLDAIKMDVAIKSKVPFRIKNNLVEASLAIDSGALNVSGTNELFGVRGSLKVLSGGRFHILANDFDIRSGTIRLDDPTRIVPNVDVVAVTEYRRYTDTTTAAAAGAGAGPGSIASQGAGNIWRITLHAYGDTEDLHLELTSDPPLSQEDIVLLLTVGMTGAEIAQVQAGSLATSAALEAVATASGADRAVKNAIPVIDDFRFGSAYSSKTGRTETQIIVGKHLTDAVRATVATGVGEDQELRATVELRLSQTIGVLGSYDNINDVSSSAVGNIGADLRWHIEFQ
jgi:translocation and assembly module TamB